MPYYDLQSQPSFGLTRLHEGGLTHRFIIMLNPRSPIPLYRQLATRIEGEIKQGVYPVDGRIPSEHTLASQYAIGRPTVRQATDLLVRQGQLERRRGSGTFVLAPCKTIDLFSLAGTTDALTRSDFDVSLVIASKPEVVDLDDSQQFATRGPDKAEESLRRVIRVVRQAKVDDSVLLSETFFFDAVVFAELTSMELEGVSLSALVKEQFYLEPVVAKQTFSAIAADSDDAELFGIAKGSPLLRVLRTLQFADAIPPIHVEITGLTNVFEFSQTLFPVVASTGQ